MANWIKTKVTFDKVVESKTSTKRVTESFLVDAINFAEAEERTIVERAPYIIGDFDVSAVAKTKIQELFLTGNGDPYYLVKWIMEMADDNPAKSQSKKAIFLTLVEATELGEALDRFYENMKSTIADFEVVQITLSDILDIYPAKSE